MKVGATVLVWREARYLEYVLRTATDAGCETVVIWSDKPWSWTDTSMPAPHGWDYQVGDVLLKLSAITNLHVLRWSGDVGLSKTPAKADRLARNVAHRIEAALGCVSSVVLDTDHLYDADEFATAVNVLRQKPGLYDASLISYWKTLDWLVGEPDATVLFSVPLAEDGAVPDIEDSSGSRELLPITCHHMSYVRSDEEMFNKLHGWGHSDIVPKHWYTDVWMQAPYVGQKVGHQVPESWIVRENKEKPPKWLRALV